MPPKPKVGAETELFTKWLADTGGFPLAEAAAGDTEPVRLRPDARPWLLMFGALCVLALVASALGLALHR